MNDREKTMLLHVALGAFESVRDDERPGSLRHRRMSQGIDRLLGLIDCYRIEAWPPAEVNKAGALVDEFNDRIATVLGGAA